MVNVEVPAGDKQTKLMDEPFQKAQEPEWSKEALVARKNHNPPSNIHAPHTAQASHRSRSPPRPREPPGDDKRPISVPRSPRRRPHSHVPSRRRQPGSPSYRGRESSVTLLSLSPGRRSSSYDFNQDDRDRHRSPGRSYRPAEPSNPPTWRQYDGPSKRYDYSHRQTHHSDHSNVLARLGCLGNMGYLATTCHFPILARSTDNIHGVTIPKRILIKPSLGMTMTVIHPDLLLDCQQHHTPSPNRSRRSRRHRKNLQSPPSNVPGTNRNIIPGQPRQSHQVTSR